MLGDSVECLAMAWRAAGRGEVEGGIGRWGVVLVLGFEYLVTLSYEPEITCTQTLLKHNVECGYNSKKCTESHNGSLSKEPYR